jgi:Ca-activated chloride channel family protein
VDFRFQAAVVEFGLLLRQSPYQGDADIAHVIAEARGAMGADREGYRGEFVRLAKLAESIGLQKDAAQRE